MKKDKLNFDNYDMYHIIVHPEIARVYGINKGCIISYIAHLMKNNIENNNTKMYVDGKWWGFKSANNLRKDNLPHITRQTIDKLFKDLINDGVLESANHNERYNTNWYTIIDEDLCEWFDIDIDKEESDTHEDTIVDSEDNTIEFSKSKTQEFSKPKPYYSSGGSVTTTQVKQYYIDNQDYFDNELIELIITINDIDDGSMGCFEYVDDLSKKITGREIHPSDIINALTEIYDDRIKIIKMYA